MSIEGVGRNNKVERTLQPNTNNKANNKEYNIGDKLIGYGKEVAKNCPSRKNK